MIHLLKKLAGRAAPGAYRRLQDHYRTHLFKRRLEKLADQLMARNGRRVMSGPFGGMVYEGRAYGSAALPKLLGSYEAEIHACLESLFRREYRVVLDIGCAEGFYAVGFAMRLPRCQVHAFDVNPQAAQWVKTLAAANAVESRITIHGRCDGPELSKLPLDNSLIFCDIDGYELELLNPLVTPQLLQADLLIETHDCLYPNITRMLVQRFEPTHHIQLFDSVLRNPLQYSATEFMCRRNRELAVHELRPPQQWMLMTRKHKTPSDANGKP